MEILAGGNGLSQIRYAFDNGHSVETGAACDPQGSSTTAARTVKCIFSVQAGNVAFPLCKNISSATAFLRYAEEIVTDNRPIHTRSAQNASLEIGVLSVSVTHPPSLCPTDRVASSITSLLHQPDAYTNPIIKTTNARTQTQDTQQNKQDTHLNSRPTHSPVVYG